MSYIFYFNVAIRQHCWNCMDFSNIVEIVCSFSDMLVFYSPFRAWVVLSSPSYPSSLCSMEWPLRMSQPKPHYLPPGQTTQLTSVWTSWVQACSSPRLISPALTPSSKVGTIQNNQPITRHSTFGTCSDLVCCF